MFDAIRVDFEYEIHYLMQRNANSNNNYNIGGGGGGGHCFNLFDVCVMERKFKSLESLITNDLYLTGNSLYMQGMPNMPPTRAHN